LQPHASVTIQPFRGGYDGGTQVEPEVIRQKVQQESQLHGRQRDAAAQERHPEESWRPEGDQSQASSGNRNQRGEREGRKGSSQAHVEKDCRQKDYTQIHTQIHAQVVGTHSRPIDEKEVEQPFIFRTEVGPEVRAKILTRSGPSQAKRSEERSNGSASGRRPESPASFLILHPFTASKLSISPAWCRLSP
jgi:hypothetical protein